MNQKIRIKLQQRRCCNWSDSAANRQKDFYCVTFTSR